MRPEFVLIKYPAYRVRIDSSRWQASEKEKAVWKMGSLKTWPAGTEPPPPEARCVRSLARSREGGTETREGRKGLWLVINTKGISDLFNQR